MLSNVIRFCFLFNLYEFSSDLESRNLIEIKGKSFQIGENGALNLWTGNTGDDKY